MNPATTHGRRDVQTLRCCGVVYRRWRFAGSRWPNTQHDACFKCGSRLHWPANYRLKPRLEYLHEWRERCLDRGLTVAGKPRKRFHHPKFKTPAESHANMLKLRKAYYRRNSIKNVQAGLTTRGMRRFDRRTEFERSWDAFRSTINTSGTSWDSISFSINRES